MPKLIRKTTRVQLPSFTAMGEDAYVEIRQRMHMGAVIETMDTSMPEGERTVRAITQLIVSWNLEDEGGKPLPISYETVKELMPEDFTAIVEASGMDEKQEKLDPKVDSASSASSPKPPTE